MMGLEEHLLGMFREDFEFHDGAAPSHLGSGHTVAPQKAAVSHAAAVSDAPASNESSWAPEAEKELKKIPFFVRSKARRNTETFARERGLAQITVETMYEAKAHFSR